MKTCLLVDNGSEAKLIDESFACTNKLSIFKLEKCINLILGNSKVVQKPIKKALVNVIIRDHNKQVPYYLAKLDAYIVILGNGQLQTHNPVIDWKQHTMKFNSVDCTKNGCLLCDMPCIEFAVRKWTEKHNWIIKTCYYKLRNRYSAGQC